MSWHGTKSSVIYIYEIYAVLNLKFDLHPPGTPKTSKNVFLLQQDWILEGFDVPGGYKSILNVKILHKSHISELFGPNVFVFRWIKKKVLSGNFGDFCADLSKIFNI